MINEISVSGPLIREVQVLENRPLAQGACLMTMDCPEIAALAEPGHFVKIRAWPEAEDGGRPLLDRPFSIHRARDGQLSILYRILGPATYQMSLASAGSLVKVSGPLGRSLAEADLNPAAGFYLAAGGIGLAPMALALDWLGGRGAATLFYGERRGAAQVDRAWLESWAGDLSATAEASPAYGRTGLLTGPLEEALKRQIRPIFACGPTPMLAAVSDLGGRYGTPVWVSAEAGMACGFGVCLTCSLPLKGGGRFRVCREGPVLDGLTVDWGKIG
ncbi:MAG: hypothetical protein LBP33_05250 [Candidatus Adiutrix sp.]|jgi:dihydroorotate dehydrogenase electron transfer subunit|nr:hypothetical protein [Candidatus Adiutrix sp.]